MVIISTTVAPFAFKGLSVSHAVAGSRWQVFVMYSQSLRRYDTVGRSFLGCQELIDGGRLLASLRLVQ